MPSALGGEKSLAEHLAKEGTLLDADYAFDHPKTFGAPGAQVDDERAIGIIDQLGRAAELDIDC